MVCVPSAVHNRAFWASSRLSLKAQHVVASFVMHIPRCRDRFPMADGALPTALGPGADAIYMFPCRRRWPLRCGLFCATGEVPAFMTQMICPALVVSPPGWHDNLMQPICMRCQPPSRFQKCRLNVSGGIVHPLLLLGHVTIRFVRPWYPALAMIPCFLQSRPGLASTPLFPSYCVIECLSFEFEGGPDPFTSSLWTHVPPLSQKTFAASSLQHPHRHIHDLDRTRCTLF
jgi:hypothetical protein